MGVLRRDLQKVLRKVLRSCPTVGKGVLRRVLRRGFSEGGLPAGTQKAETRPFVEYDPLGTCPS